MQREVKLPAQGHTAARYHETLQSPELAHAGSPRSVRRPSRLAHPRGLFVGSYTRPGPGPGAGVRGGHKRCGNCPHGTPGVTGQRPSASKTTNESVLRRKAGVTGTCEGGRLRLVAGDWPPAARASGIHVAVTMQQIPAACPRGHRATRDEVCLVPALW